jgi:hypothetical protein
MLHCCYENVLIEPIWQICQRTYQNFFYLAAEKAICRHCKMCLELQVAFSF